MLYLPAEALTLVRKAEGLRLDAYLCPAGKWTIGYGHTGPEVKKGLKWTADKAEQTLIADMLDAAKAVDSLCRVPITLNHRGALSSFVFNLGRGALSGSTLLKLLNAGDYTGAADQFTKWVYAKVDGVPVKLPGLVTRREGEKALFLKP